jgi:hypothetical protein
MFAMTGLLMRGDDSVMESAFALADEFMEARDGNAEHQKGIVAIKKRKKHVPE